MFRSVKLVLFECNIILKKYFRFHLFDAFISFDWLHVLQVIPLYCQLVVNSNRLHYPDGSFGRISLHEDRNERNSIARGRQTQCLVIFNSVQ